MLGITESLADELAARGYSENDVARIFGPKAHEGELRIIYSRGNARDLTSPLPSSRHMYYLQRGFEAVAIADDPSQPVEQLVSVPAEIQEYARHDRVGIWSRKNGRDIMNSSCRNAAALLSKGWEWQGVGRS